MTVSSSEGLRAIPLSDIQLSTTELAAADKAKAPAKPKSTTKKKAAKKAK